MLLFACVPLVFWSRTPHRGMGRGPTRDGPERAREAQAQARRRGRRQRHTERRGAHATGRGALRGELAMYVTYTVHNAKDTRV